MQKRVQHEIKLRFQDEWQNRTINYKDHDLEHISGRIFTSSADTPTSYILQTTLGDCLFCFET